ncbi:MAG: anti-sigma factor [Solirubrobacteraceae bacterium]
MNAPHLTLKRHRLSRARRLAAQRVLDEFTPGQPTGHSGQDDAQVDSELAQMQRVAAVLRQMPESAWPTPALPQTRAAGAAQRFSRLRPIPSVAVVLAFATLALAFLAGSLTHPLTGSGSPAGTAAHQHAPHVVLSPVSPGASAHGTAVAYMTGGAHMTLTLKGLPSSAPGTYYELWLMTSYTRLVPVASFRVGTSGGGTLRLLLPDNPHAYRYLDISVQRLGAGSAISRQSVLRGAIPA